MLHCDFVCRVALLDQKCPVFRADSAEDPLISVDQVDPRGSRGETPTGALEAIPRGAAVKIWVGGVIW